MLVPASVFGVVIFLLFVAPGICYELLRGRTQQPKEESAFIQISRVLLSGTLISVLASIILYFVALLSPTTAVDLSALVAAPTPYVAAHFQHLIWVALQQLTFSILLAVISSDLKTSKTASFVNPGHPWYGITEPALTPRNTNPYVLVRLKSGVEVKGYFRGTTTELDPTKREIMLYNGLELRASDDKPFLAFEGWKQIVIPGSEITYVAACYIPKPGVQKDDGEDKNKIGEMGKWIVANWTRWQIALAGILATVCAAFIVGAT